MPRGPGASATSELVIKPAALRPGDRVGVVAPASYFKRERFDAGCARLRQLGYEPVFLDGIFERDLYFAGSAERRARELEEMFARDDVRAIVCARGGYGAIYLLPHLNVDIVRRHPKILVAYSDLTCLLTWLHDAAGLVTFHGPMLTGDFAREDGVDQSSWTAAVTGSVAWRFASHGMSSLVTGVAEGVLYGGCLSILAASLGTPYEARTEGKLLFLEDVAAKPYQIDRMLMQMKLAGKLHGVRGIVFGEMKECVQAHDQPYTLPEVVKRIVADLGVPVAYGLPSGHVSRGNVTLPFGVRARLTASSERVTLELLENAVGKPAAHG